jgi:O-antigen/teichoic acid export membrane protein
MGVNYAILLLLTPFTWHRLSQEELGIWTLLTTIITYFGLSNMGFLQSLVTELPKRRHDRHQLDKLISTVFFTLLGFSVVGLLAAFVIYFGFEYFFKISSENVGVAKASFWPAYVTFLLMFMSSIFQNIMLSSAKIVEKNLLEIAKIILTNGLIFVLILMGHGLVAIMWATFAVTVLYCLGLYWQAKNTLPFTLSFGFYDKAIFRQLAKPSLYYFIIGIGYQIVFFSDNILIANLAGASFVAVYAFTYRIPDICLKLIMKITDMKLPKITVLNSEKRFGELLQIHNRLMLFTLAIAVPVCLGLILFGVDVLEFWLNDRNRFDPQIMWIFAVYMLIHTIIHVPSAFISGMGIHKRLSYFSLLEAVLNIGFSIFFYQRIGLAGIALGTLLASIPSLIFVLYEFYGYIYRTERIRSFRQLFKIS